MSDELLAKVLAKPDDNKARAAYAAALHAAGDPRGEFIDIQLDLAKHADPTTPAATKLARRAAELHKRNAGKWAKTLRALGKPATWTFDRGFVKRLSLGGAEPRISALNDVFAVEPVTELVVQGGSAGWWTTLFASAGMRRIQRLVVLVVPPESKKLVPILVKAELPKLRELRIGLLGGTEVSALEELGGRELHHLALGCGGHDMALTEKGLGPLLAAPIAKQLDTLELGRCAITPRMANMICATKLERFSASYGEFDEVESQLRARFKKNFIVEDEPSFDYLLLGVKGLSR